MRDRPVTGCWEGPQEAARGPHEVIDNADRNSVPVGYEPPHPRLLVRSAGDVLIVDVLNAGLFAGDHDVEELGGSLLRLAREGHVRILLNLEGLEYVSSRLLATLVSLNERVARARGFLKLCRLEPGLRDTLRVCCLDTTFEIHDTECEALAAGALPAIHEYTRGDSRHRGG